MGKDLKGRELGKGIGQNKDKRYYARYTNRNGKRMPPFYSFDLREVKDWLLKQKYEDKLGKAEIPNKNITVKEVYKCWIEEKKKDVKPQTISVTMGKYNSHIKQYEHFRIIDIDKNFADKYMKELIALN